ncbi:MAG: hypothetical protein ACYSX0_21385, partial [Planctomycetota bacterium]
MRILRRLWARLRGTKAAADGLTVIRRPDGSIAVVDQAMLDHLQSTAPDPSQDSLDAVLSDARRVRVYRGGAASGQPLEKEVLFETDAPDALSTLREALRIVEGEGGQCMCHGDPTLELLYASGQRLAVIGVHHGHSIRWDAWRDDAVLVDGRSLLGWLADQGATYPLREYEENLRLAEESEAEWKRWQAATPACLRQFVGGLDESPGEASSVPDPGSSAPSEQVGGTKAGPVTPKRALEAAYPNRAERARALLAWFGSSTSPWSEYPLYESFAEELLMDLPIGDLLRALEAPDLTGAHREGAARLFAGREFTSKRPKDAARLPESLKRRLLEHCLQSADSDKHARARAAFG